MYRLLEKFYPDKQQLPLNNWLRSMVSHKSIWLLHGFAEITAGGRDHAKLLAEATLESLRKGTIDFKLDVAFQRIEHSTEAQLVFEFAAGGFKHILVTVKPPHMQEYKFELKGIWTLENSDFTVTLTDQNSRREKTLLRREVTMLETLITYRKRTKML